MDELKIVKNDEIRNIFHKDPSVMSQNNSSSSILAKITKNFAKKADKSW